VAAPSTTRINGELAIRVAITNHRTGRSDVDAFLDATLSIGRRLAEHNTVDQALEAAYRE
jgi:aromatic-L-amino-acid/L-tryptophan decarboxylase